MYAGRTPEQKKVMTEKLTRAVMESLGVEEYTISIDCEEFASTDWAEKVYRPEIMGRKERLLKQPGYNPLEK
jgi:4-oxalocrotonate tautomerase